MTCSISELRVDDIGLVGGKAANLGELTSSGFQVPPGFVVTTEAFDRFVDSNRLDIVLDDVIARIDVTSDVSLQDASKVRNAFVRAAMPKTLEDEILNAYSGIGHSEEQALVAVRSSATAEDLPTASFAGQQDTYLNC